MHTKAEGPVEEQTRGSGSVFLFFFVNVEDGRSASRRERRAVTEGKKARTDPELPDHFLSLVL